MKTLQIITLSILVGLGVLFAAALIRGLFLAIKHHELIQAAEAFAAGATKADCLHRLVGRMTDCLEVSCTESDIGFTAICLEVAHGDREPLCLGQSVKPDLADSFCGAHVDRARCATLIEGTVAFYCIETSL